MLFYFILINKDIHFSTGQINSLWNRDCNAALGWQFKFIYDFSSTHITAYCHLAYKSYFVVHITASSKITLELLKAILFLPVLCRSFIDTAIKEMMPSL